MADHFLEWKHALKRSSLPLGTGKRKNAYIRQSQEYSLPLISER